MTDSRSIHISTNDPISFLFMAEHSKHESQRHFKHHPRDEQNIYWAVSLAYSTYTEHLFTGSCSASLPVLKQFSIPTELKATAACFMLSFSLWFLASRLHVVQLQCISPLILQMSPIMSCSILVFLHLWGFSAISHSSSSHIPCGTSTLVQPIIISPMGNCHVLA